MVIQFYRAASAGDAGLAKKQAQAETFALGGKKRFEDHLFLLLGHALAGVGQGHLQAPVFELRDVEGYWSYWHGEKGYSGVAMLVAKSLTTVFPSCSHPGFDFEQRIDRNAAGHRNTTEIVAQKINDHQIFGTVLIRCP